MNIYNAKYFERSSPASHNVPPKLARTSDFNFSASQFPFYQMEIMFTHLIWYSETKKQKSLIHSHNSLSFSTDGEEGTWGK